MAQKKSQPFSLPVLEPHSGRRPPLPPRYLRRVRQPSSAIPGRGEVALMGYKWTPTSSVCKFMFQVGGGRDLHGVGYRPGELRLLPQDAIHLQGTPGQGGERSRRNARPIVCVKVSVFILFSDFCVPFSFPSPPSLLEAMEKERSANWKEIPLKITRFYRGILSKKPETVQ